MDEALVIWGYLTLLNISHLFGFILGGLIPISIFGVVGSIIFYNVQLDGFAKEQEIFKEDFKRLVLRKRYFLIIGFMVLFTVLVPSKEDMKIIIGGSVAYQLTEIEGVENLPKNLVGAANRFLEEIEK